MSNGSAVVAEEEVGSMGYGWAMAAEGGGPVVSAKQHILIIIIIESISNLNSAFTFVLGFKWLWAVVPSPSLRFGRSTD